MKKALSNIGKLFGLKEGKQDITASYEYEGTNPTDKINLSIDMSAADLGKYNLTITVKDLNSDKRISKTVKFDVQDKKINYLF